MKKRQNKNSVDGRSNTGICRLQDVYRNHDPHDLHIFIGTTNTINTLEQLEDNQWRPIKFFSRKLNTTERNYSSHDRELLTVFVSIKYFKHILESR